MENLTEWSQVMGMLAKVDRLYLQKCEEVNMLRRRIGMDTREKEVTDEEKLAYTE